MKPECQGSRRMSWRAAAVVPVAIVAWMGLGLSSGSAFAAAGGNGNGNSDHANSAAASSSAASTVVADSNGNGKSSDAPGQVKKQDAPAPAPTTTSVDTSSSSAPAANNGNGNDHSTQGNSGTFGDPTQPQPLSNANHNKGGANNGGNCGAYCSTRDGSPSQNGNGNGKATGKPCAGCVGKADNKNPKGQAPNGSDHNNGYECDGNHGIGKGNPAHTACKPPCVDTPGHPCTPPCVDTPGHPCTPPCVDKPGKPCTPPCVDTPGHPCTPPCVDTPGHPCTPPCVDTPGHPCTPPCSPNASNDYCGNGGDCTTTGTCPAGCKATHTCKPPTCTPTKANNFCSTVKGRVHHRTTTVTPPTTVLGEKVTRTPNALPFTGAPVAALLGWALLALVLGGLLLMAGSRQTRQSTAERLRTVLAYLGARPAMVPAGAAAGGGRWQADPRRRQLTTTKFRLATPPRLIVRRARVRHRRRF